MYLESRGKKFITRTWFKYMSESSRKSYMKSAQTCFPDETHIWVWIIRVGGNRRRTSICSSARSMPGSISKLARWAIETRPMRCLRVVSRVHIWALASNLIRTIGGALTT